jgi:hypothetical protein
MLLLVKELLVRHPGRCSGFEIARKSSIPARFAQYLSAKTTKSRPWPSEQFPEATSLHPSVYVALDRISADAPACSDLAGTPGHNGYYSLPRCIQRGEYITTAGGKKGHMEFRLIDCGKVLRMDSRWNSYKKAIAPFPDDPPQMVKKIQVRVTFIVCEVFKIHELPVNLLLNSPQILDPNFHISFGYMIDGI